MDILYFNTKNKEGILTELSIPLDVPTFYDSGNGWTFQWIGRLPKTIEKRLDALGNEYDHILDWQEGYFFNIYSQGQENMDYFTKSVKAAKQILPEPNTPLIKLL